LTAAGPPLSPRPEQAQARGERDPFRHRRGRPRAKLTGRARHSARWSPVPARGRDSARAQHTGRFRNSDPPGRGKQRVGGGAPAPAPARAAGGTRGATPGPHDAFGKGDGGGKQRPPPSRARAGVERGKAKRGGAFSRPTPPFREIARGHGRAPSPVVVVGFAAGHVACLVFARRGCSCRRRSRAVSLPLSLELCKCNVDVSGDRNGMVCLLG
jgi:hypothetical protein